MNRLRLYIDEDAMGRSLLIALRARHVDVVTATEANMTNKSDEEHLRWATANSRVLYSFNIADYIQLHQRSCKSEEAHGGIVLAQQKRFSVGEQTRRLLRLMSTLSAEEMRGRLEFLTSWSDQPRGTAQR